MASNKAVTSEVADKQFIFFQRKKIPYRHSNKTKIKQN